jgi:type III pantothenate kinase
VVGAEGDYLGAVIAPGIDVAAEGLGSRAAQLGRIELQAPPHAIASSTSLGVQSGIVFGYAGMVDGLIRRVREEIGPAPVVATGDGPWLPSLLELTRGLDAYDPLLTLRGLRLIHDQNPGRS